MNYVYKRDDGANTAAIIQFRQNAIPNTNLNLVKKSGKVDQIHAIFFGLDSVDFGKKDPKTCFKPQAAIMKDTTSSAGALDWTACVSYSKDMGR